MQHVCPAFARLPPNAPVAVLLLFEAPAAHGVSRFSLSVQRIAALHGPGWIMGERMTAHTHPGSRILLVEDSDDLRGLMTLILEAEGYVVDSASTAEEGLHLLNARPYDLVLSDYALPGRTGAWMLREALERQLLSRGIIVTAHPNPRDAEGFPVIYKPLDFDSFLDQVRGYIDNNDHLAWFGSGSAGGFRPSAES
jgi:CheY-like chemotaxis protein